MSRSAAFALMLTAIALGLTNIALIEARPPNAGLPLVRNAYGSTTDDSWPPARFQGDANAFVRFVAVDKIDAACGVKHDREHPEEACEQGALIVLPNPCLFPRGEIFARLACHELAHVNNWPENHPR